MSAPRILVVEDEAIIADDVQRTLVSLGYEAPAAAATGLEAIELCRTLRPDLVLMDIQLRGSLDGIETAGRIRTRTPIPIVFLTSHSDDATLTRAKQSQPSGYLLKPFSDRELRTAIEVALHKTGLENLLAERERWFSTTLQSIGDAVIATDMDQRVTFMNGVAEQLTGWRSDEAKGHPVAEVLRLVDRAGAPVACPVSVALATRGGAGLPPDTSLVTRDGRTVQIDDSATPIASGDGDILGSVIVFRDVTDRRRLEQRVLRSERLASLGTLAAGVAHEINNPLTYVIGNVSFAREAITNLRDALEAGDCEVALDELGEIEAALGDAAEGGERVGDIVQSLGRFSRTDDRHRRALALQPLLEASLRMTAARRRVRVQREYASCPAVLGTEGALTQLFGNLIVNAADALENREGAVEIVTSTAPGGWAVVEIRDDGPGIREPERVFDLFYTTKAVGQGMGLGLSICHEIVTALGGTISASNRPGGGACFRIELPAAPPEPIAALTEERAAPTLARLRVLVVDDEAPVAAAIARIVKHQLHDVDVATDGAAARTLLAQNRYDVVLCDLMMPHVSGTDLFDEIAARDPALAARFVIITGGALTDRARDLLASGARHANKPLTAASIRALLGLVGSRA